MKNVSNVLLDYVYAVIYLYRGEKLCNIMHHLKVQRTILKKKKKVAGLWDTYSLHHVLLLVLLPLNQ